MEGHVYGVRLMVDAERAASEVLQQVHAIQGSLRIIRILLLKEHLYECLQTDESRMLTDNRGLQKALDQILQFQDIYFTHPISINSSLKENLMAQAIDPVCGMTVDTETAEFTSNHKGQTYYFCAAGCKKAFEREPESYLFMQHYESGHEPHEHHQSQ
ncbi:MAG: metal-sensing transcriptional repressor [Caldilineales bacterium]|nr:metal-sensing transcriptional repressor [Caldilineales bacterium]